MTLRHLPGTREAHMIKATPANAGGKTKTPQEIVACSTHWCF
jgi:hypothetical protein